MRMLSLGGNVMVRRDAIVGVFDLDTATVSKHSRDFLRRAQENKAVTAAGLDLPQTFIVTPDIVYLSAQSSAQIAKRLG